MICMLVTSASAQTRGDENKDMYNRAQQRDQKVIDEAVSGWWEGTHEIIRNPIDQTIGLNKRL